MTPDLQEDNVGPSNRWQIDRRIPISLLIAIFVQTVIVLIWAVTLNNRVGQLESNTVSKESYARIDEKMTSLKDEISDLKTEVHGLNDEVRRMAVRGKP